MTFLLGMLFCAALGFFCLYTVYAALRFGIALACRRIERLRIIDAGAFLLLGMLLIFGVGNFLGFSWDRYAFVPESEIIQVAIKGAYPDLYDSAEELLADYPGFRIEVSRAVHASDDVEPDFLDRLTRSSGYRVRLPTAMAMVSSSGVFRNKYWPFCGDEACERPATKSREYGVSGFAFLRADEDIPAEITGVSWQGFAPESAQVSWNGNCYAASARSAYGHTLVVSLADNRKIEIPGDYGFYRETRQVYATSGKSYPGTSQRIRKSEFATIARCDALPLEKVPSATVAAPY